MANFYLQPVNQPDILYELNATTDVMVSYSSSVTNYPIESGSVVSDNVVMNPDQVSFDGILTAVKQSGFSPSSFIANTITGRDDGTPKSWSEYIEDLRLLQFDKQVFKVYYSGKNDGELSNIEFAILTQFEIKKDTSLGESWAVSVSLQEIRYAQTAQIVSAPQIEYTSKLATNQDGSGNTSGLDESQTEQVNKRWKTAGYKREDVKDEFGNLQPKYVPQ